MRRAKKVYSDGERGCERTSRHEELLLEVEEIGRVLLEDELVVDLVVVVDVEVETPHPRVKEPRRVDHCWMPKKTMTRQRGHSVATSSAVRTRMGYWRMMVRRMKERRMEAPTYVLGKCGGDDLFVRVM